MKTIVLSILVTLSISISLKAQIASTLTVQNSEISDNLDLRTVASVFADSRNVGEFEQKLNDSRLQISNLDLNFDGQVDYLRVIESLHQRIHLITIQAVLDRNLYQDIATIEVDKRQNHAIQMHIIGNSYFYGPNYVFAPQYFCTPKIYSSFWQRRYRPYFSAWSWNSYPSNFSYYQARPIIQYQTNVNIFLSKYRQNNYNYVVRNGRPMYSTTNNSFRAFEMQHPECSFTSRNSAVTNRYELEQTRNRTTNRLPLEQTNESSLYTTSRPFLQRESFDYSSVAAQDLSVNRNYSGRQQGRTTMQAENQNLQQRQENVNTRSQSQRTIERPSAYSTDQYSRTNTSLRNANNTTNTNRRI